MHLSRGPQTCSYFPGGIRMGARLRRVKTGLFSVQLWACSLLFLPQAFGLNQERAQNNTGKLNNTGSDNSMDAATNSAMRAMMSLAALNIPGAFSNGYKAYGQFINSEKMDDVELKALRRRGSMASLGSAGSAGGTGSASGGNGSAGGAISGTTSFSRLDPSYLYRGETGETANEFEKVSGMKRETFFKHLASATDSDLNYNDPNLLQKLETRFAAFKADVPNATFKEGLEKAEKLFPQEARVEALGRLSSMYSEAWANSPADISSPALAGSGAAEIPAAIPLLPLVPAQTADSSGENEATPEGGRQLASSPASREGVYIGISATNSEEMVNEFLSTPTAAETESLFVKVSKRYRQLTPALLGRL
jgi:hypothetical protein